MTTNKFLTKNSGQTQLTTAISTSAGVGDASKIVATTTNGKIDPTLMPAGVGVSTFTVLASEALSAGDFVNIYNNAGTLNVRKADNSNSREANGFVLAAVSNAANATVYLNGQNTSVSALTPGTVYYLGTAGAVTTTPPANTATGSIIQVLGKTLSATNLPFEYDEPTYIV